LLSKIAAVMPYSDSKSQDAIKFEDARQEAICGLKKSHAQESISGQKKTKVCIMPCLFPFSVLTKFKVQAVVSSTFKVSSIIFLPYGVIKVGLFPNVKNGNTYF